MVPLIYSNDNRKRQLKLTKPGNVILLFVDNKGKY